MKTVHTDVLVIGGGLSGLRIGIGAKRRGYDVIILLLVSPKRSHSCAAQGGMQASHAMLYTMSDQVIAHQIPVHERTEAIALIHDGGRCYGAIVRDLVTGQLIAYVAKATAITSGGAGR